MGNDMVANDDMYASGIKSMSTSGCYTFSNVSGGDGSISLSGEYGKHLSSVFISIVNHIHVILYDLIQIDFYNPTILLNHICYLIIFSNRQIHIILNNFSSIKMIKNNFDTNVKSFKNCLTSIIISVYLLKYLLTSLFDILKPLEFYLKSSFSTPFHINLPNLNPRIPEIIKKLNFCIIQFDKIESLLISAKSIVYELKESKNQLMVLNNSIPSEESNSVYFKIKCCCDMIDKISSAIEDFEFYTWCLKYWIYKFINLDISNNLLNRFLFTDKIIETDFDGICSNIKSLYCSICEICNICNSESKCQCNCKCGDKCTENTICLCLCKCDKTEANGCCICICKHGDSSSCKCICICICKNGDKCCCSEGKQHTCEKCLFKIEITSLKDQTSGILCHLRWIKCYIPRCNRKCCFCYCCQITCCYKSCCIICEKSMYYYKSIMSRIHWIESLFKQIGTKINQLITLNNILSPLLIMITKCKPCGGDCCNKIQDLINIISTSCTCYYKFGSGIKDIRSLLEYILFYPKSKQILCSLESSIRPLLNQLRQINYYIVRSTNINSSSEMILVSTNRLDYIDTNRIKIILIIISKYEIAEYNVMLYKLSKYLYKSWDILGILSTGIRRCCCICCFKYNLRCRKFKFTEFPDEYDTRVDHHMQFYLRSMADNHGNNLCLCLVTKYVLLRNVRTLMCYMRDIVGDLYSSLSRRFDKYTHSTTNLMSVGKLIMLLIKVIHKVTLWMKHKYLCTCIPGCPCCCPGRGTCSCDCRVCSQPEVTCCTCPSKLNNCTTNGNSGNNCCCKCSQKNGEPCSKCCSGNCGQDKCCRCCCNCFCKNYQDPWYPYLISIILYVSSVMENIWTMDIESLRMAIECLSSLLAEYQSIHVYTNYGSPESIRDVTGSTEILRSKSWSTLTQYINTLSITTITSNSNVNLQIGLHTQMIKSQTLVKGCIKSFFKSLLTSMSILIKTPLFSLVYSNISGLAFYINEKSKIIGVSSGFLRTSLMSLSIKYLDCSKLQSKCGTTNGCNCRRGCKICVVGKIIYLSLSITMKMVRYVLSSAIIDLITNKCIKLYKIINDMNRIIINNTELILRMTKNNVINTSTSYNHLNNHYSYNIKDIDSRNWGYDTKYEHDVSTDKGFRRGDWYPNLLSDPRYTFSHLSLFFHNYPYNCMISIFNK